jgi:hypothetical protein
MANPLMNMMGGMMGNAGGNNPMAIMQKFQEFRKQFPANANPQQILNQMVQSGRVTQGQIDQAVQMAKQMGLIK